MRKNSEKTETTIDATSFAPSDWLKFGEPGFAKGWEGQAWVHLQRIGAGLAEPDEALLRALVVRASALEKRPVDAECGAMCGASASALVFALSAEVEKRAKPLASMALARWKASCSTSKKYDFMAGRAGALVTCAELEGRKRGLAPVALARKLHAECIERTRALLDIAHDGPVFIGLTHGLVGFMFALENGRAAFGFSIPKGLLEEAYDQVFEASLVGDDGSIYCRNTNQEPYVGMHAWCHGAPGVGIGLLACDHLSQSSRYQRYVRGALRSTFTHRDEKLSFCCGMTGRAHILVEAYRLGGAKKPLLLAQAKELRDLTKRAAMSAQEPFAFELKGFLKGRSALRYLDDRLEHPTKLPMPGLGLLTGQCGRGAS